MKTIFAVLGTLLVGLAIGFYVGYRYSERHTTNEAVRQTVENGESSHALLAATGTRAIGFIDSGESQKAVEILSRAIARYYTIYAATESTNEERLKLRAMIDDLARTNQTVAAAIAALKSSQ